MALSTDLTLLYRFAENAGDVGDLAPRYTGLGPTLTHTRASPATYYDSAGILQTAAANQARNKDHDPETLAPLGLLVEDGSNNAVRSSEDLSDASWAPSGVTVTVNQVAAPDGTLTADRINETATGGSFHRTESGLISFNDNDVLTVSVYASPFAGSPENIFRLEFAEVVDVAWAEWDVVTGAFSLSGAAGTFTVLDTSVEEAANGFRRYSLTLDVGANSSSNGKVRLYCRAGGGQYFGDPAVGYHFWGAQCETSPIPTSYIKTTGAAVIRPADVVSTTDVGFYTQSGPGTFYCDSSPSDTVNSFGNYQDIVLVNMARGGSGNTYNSLILYTEAGGNAWRNTRGTAREFGGGGVTTGLAPGPVYGGGVQVQTSYAFQDSGNGTSRVAYAGNLGGAANGALIPNLDLFELGVSNQITSRNFLRRNHYAEVRHYNTRRPDDQAYTGPDTGGLLQLSLGQVPEEEDAPQPPTGITYQMLI